MRLLLVEDERRLAGHVGQGLREEGYAVDIAHDCRTAGECVVETDYDLIVLDLMLPDGSGVELLSEWRRDELSCPVLVLTARDSVGDKVSCLDVGADDYLTKPFAFEELLARLRSLSRRREKRPVQLLSVGDITFDCTSRAAKRGDRSLDLTPRETAVLEHFLLHPNRVLDRFEIADHAWDRQYEARSNTVDVIIGRLRRKLEQGGGSRLIQTVKGLGYVLRSSEAGQDVPD